MKVLKFTLSGETAFFKKPDVNTYLYFTYGNVHKVALLGIFGAIIGYSGYNQQKKHDVYPEFYDKLKDVKIAIRPNAENGFIPKKVQVFNNSIGYASQEQGGNLIVKEQWLEKPSWDIYILINCEDSERIAKYILNNESIYMPYLGKNDHIANITNVELFENIKVLDSITRIDCLSPKGIFTYETENQFSANRFLNGNNKVKGKPRFKYEEKLPIKLNDITNMYEYESFIYTNMKVSKNEDVDVYSVNSKNIIFY
ncbi:MAG: type I-B CRISPR-associated protein Cas5b [Clostridium sp.]